MQRLLELVETWLSDGRLKRETLPNKFQSVDHCMKAISSEAFLKQSERKQLDTKRNLVLETLSQIGELAEGFDPPDDATAQSYLGTCPKCGNSLRIDVRYYLLESICKCPCGKSSTLTELFDSRLESCNSFDLNEIKVLANRYSIPTESSSRKIALWIQSQNLHPSPKFFGLLIGLASLPAQPRNTSQLQDVLSEFCQAHREEFVQHANLRRVLRLLAILEWDSTQYLGWYFNSFGTIDLNEIKQFAPPEDRSSLFEEAIQASLQATESFGLREAKQIALDIGPIPMRSVDKIVDYLIRSCRQISPTETEKELQFRRTVFQPLFIRLFETMFNPVEGRQRELMERFAQFYREQRLDIDSVDAAIEAILRTSSRTLNPVSLLQKDVAFIYLDRLDGANEHLIEECCRCLGRATPLEGRLAQLDEFGPAEIEFFENDRVQLNCELARKVLVAFRELNFAARETIAEKILGWAVFENEWIDEQTRSEIWKLRSQLDSSFERPFWDLLQVHDENQQVQAAQAYVTQCPGEVLTDHAMAIIHSHDEKTRKQKEELRKQEEERRAMLPRVFGIMDDCVHIFKSSPIDLDLAYYSCSKVGQSATIDLAYSVGGYSENENMCDHCEFYCPKK